MPKKRFTDEQISPTLVPASARLSANAICCSVNFNFFIDYRPSKMAYRSRKILTQSGLSSWEGTKT